MKVFVTGATGFIGGNVALALAKRGDEVVALARPGSSTLTIEDAGVRIAIGDVTDRESVARAIKGCRAVVHCAAMYAFWTREPRRMYEVNVGGTAVVLEEALKEGVDACVHTSTVSTVGIPKGGLGTEETRPAAKDLVGHYKKSKYMAEGKALELAQQGLPLVVVNPTAPVGRWDVKPTPTGRVVLDFIRGKMPAYINTGMNMVDVEDVAAGHILALEKGRPGERYILGNVNMTLGQIFKLLEVVAGRKAPKIRLPIWSVIAAGYLDGFVEGRLLGREPSIPVEALKVAKKPMFVNCQKAINELGLPQSPIEGALEKAVKWYHDHGYVGDARVARAGSGAKR